MTPPIDPDGPLAHAERSWSGPEGASHASRLRNRRTTQALEGRFHREAIGQVGRPADQNDPISTSLWWSWMPSQCARFVSWRPLKRPSSLGTKGMLQFRQPRLKDWPW